MFVTQLTTCCFSVLVGENSSVFGDQHSSDEEDSGTKHEQGATIFSSSWLPGSDSKYGYWFYWIFLFSVLHCC